MVGMAVIEPASNEATDFKSVVFTKVSPHAEYWCAKRESNSHTEVLVPKTSVSTVPPFARRGCCRTNILSKCSAAIRSSEKSQGHSHVASESYLLTASDDTDAMTT